MVIAHLSGGVEVGRAEDDGLVSGAPTAAFVAVEVVPLEGHPDLDPVQGDRLGRLPGRSRPLAVVGVGSYAGLGPHLGALVALGDGVELLLLAGGRRLLVHEVDAARLVPDDQVDEERA